MQADDSKSSTCVCTELILAAVVPELSLEVEARGPPRSAQCSAQVGSLEEGLRPLEPVDRHIVLVTAVAVCGEDIADRLCFEDEVGEARCASHRLVCARSRADMMSG